MDDIVLKLEGWSLDNLFCNIIAELRKFVNDNSIAVQAEEDGEYERVGLAEIHVSAGIRKVLQMMIVPAARHGNDVEFSYQVDLVANGSNLVFKGLPIIQSDKVGDFEIVGKV
jgi:hypothetical protein